MECSIVFKCECSDRTYPSSQSLKAHQKTQMHKSWVNTKELRDMKIFLTERDNEILRLKGVVDNLKELNTILIKRISLQT